MIRACVVGGVAAAFALATAAPGFADPSDPVPGMSHGVIETQPCSNWLRFTYGFSPLGEHMACVSFDGSTGEWSRSTPVVGVREPGTSCDAAQGYLAQAPDGRPIQCSNSIWYLPPNGNQG
ncbi:MAG: hypothetical protein QOH60_4675 [Mycobacterium sp.]|jgi:hypothetical protein|nr:hypothetical protein [Mycobacterium sp.]